MELVYWPIRGRAEYVRWIMKYLGVNYKERNPTSLQQWAQWKSRNSPSNPMINLPFLKDGDTIVSETVAIVEHICLSANGGRDLLGKGPGATDKLLIRSIDDSMMGVREFCLTLVGFEEKEMKRAYKKEGLLFQKVIIKVLPLMSFMNPKQTWIFDYLTVVDFQLAFVVEILDFIERYTGLENPLKAYPILYQVRDSIFALSGVRNYIESQDFTELSWAPIGSIKFTDKTN